MSLFHSLLYLLFTEQSPDRQMFLEEQGPSDRVTSLGLSKCLSLHCSASRITHLLCHHLTEPLMALPDLPPSVPGPQLPGLSSCLCPFQPHWRDGGLVESPAPG